MSTKRAEKSYTLGLAEVKERTSRSRATVYRWVVTGQLPAVNFSGTWRVNEQDLIDFLGSVNRLANDEEDTRLSVADIRARLNLSRWPVQKLLISGELRGVKVGCEWRVTEEDFRAFLTSRTNIPASELRRAS